RPIRAPQVGASAAYMGIPRAFVAAEETSFQQEIVPPTFRAPIAADSHARSSSSMHGIPPSVPSSGSIGLPQRRPIDRPAREGEDRQIASTRFSTEPNRVPQGQVPATVRGQVHQPFRDELIKINPIHAERPPFRSLPTGASVQASKTATVVSPDKMPAPKRDSVPQHVSQSPIPPHQAALSSLKSQQKKD
ncbi:MAG: hypothetical protein AAB869_00335, partial [Patescibacteria group bacterium]